MEASRKWQKRKCIDSASAEKPAKRVLGDAGNEGLKSTSERWKKLQATARAVGLDGTARKKLVSPTHKSPAPIQLVDVALSVMAKNVRSTMKVLEESLEEVDDGFEREAEQAAIRAQQAAARAARLQVLLHLVLLAAGFAHLSWPLLMDTAQACGGGGGWWWPSLVGRAGHLGCRGEGGDGGGSGAGAWAAGAGGQACGFGQKEEDEDAGAAPLALRACPVATWHVVVSAAALLLAAAASALVAHMPKTKRFREEVRRVFEEVAAGKPSLDELGVEASVLLLYDTVNACAPRHITRPASADTQRLLEVFDDDGDGLMDVDEFQDFAVFLYNQLVLDMGLVLLLDLVLAPLYATLLHHGLKRATAAATGAALGIPVVLLVTPCVKFLRKSIFDEARNTQRAVREKDITSRTNEKKHSKRAVQLLEAKCPCQSAFGRDCVFCRKCGRKREACLSTHGSSDGAVAF